MLLRPPRERHTMAFNSNTYHANKEAKLAWKSLADARTLRDRVRAGEAYGWEAETTLPSLVRSALFGMKRSVFYRSQSALEAAIRALNADR